MPKDGHELTNEQCNGLQPCTTCVSRGNNCTYASLSFNMPRAKARYHHENSNHSSHHSANSQQSQTNAFAPHTNDRMPEGFHLSPTRTMGSAENRGTAASDRNASSVGSVAGNLVPRPVERAFQREAGDQFEQVPSEHMLGASPVLPVDTGLGNHDGYRDITGSGDGSHGGQRQTEDVSGNGNRKVISGEDSEGNESERLNEQSRLLNDGKGRLCKFTLLAKPRAWDRRSGRAAGRPPA